MEANGAQWIRHWVNSRAGLEAMVREPSFDPAGNRSILGRATRNVAFIPTDLSRILFESNRLIMFILLERNQGISVDALVNGN
jgi:hypothetical protein